MAGSSTITIRDALLADAQAHEEDHLKAAIDWAEKAQKLIKDGDATLQEIDQACPFNRGDEPWFFLVLLMNKYYKTLHGPYYAMIRKGWSAKHQAIFDGLVCANCYNVGGPRMIIKLRRCTRCRLVSYCGRSCQRAHLGHHREQCNQEDDKIRRRNIAFPKFRQFEMPATASEPAVQLIARHIFDGYDRSSLVLYEMLTDGNANTKKERSHRECPWAVVTVPVHDDDYRNNQLGPNEACLDLQHYSREIDALIVAEIVVPIPGKFHICEDEKRKPMPVARLDLEQIELGDL